MSVNELTIREAVIEDRGAIYGLLVELGYPGIDRGRFDKTFEQFLARDDLWLLVAERDHRVLGLASMSERPQLRLAGSLVTIDEMVIGEAARGLGIGAMLLAEAKRRAKELGARRLQLDTSRKRESYLRGFYAKNGLTEADSAVMRLEFPKDDDR